MKKYKLKKLVINLKCLSILNKRKRKNFRKSCLQQLDYKKIPANVHPNVTVGKNFEIGRFSYINANTHIGHDTKIGSFCSIARSVEIAPHSHPIYLMSTHTFQYQSNKFADYENYKNNTFFPIESLSKQTIIEHDVWIGTKSIIMKGVHIGTGAIIGAGSIVTKDIPPYAIAVGVPAKVIKYRFDNDLIEELLNSKWWEKDLLSLQHLPYDNVKECLLKLSAENIK